MSVSTNYKMTFGSVMPDILTQVLEGTMKKEYEFQRGTITVILHDRKDEESFNPHCRHRGSLQVGAISELVEELFRNVNFYPFYCQGEAARGRLLGVLRDEVANNNPLRRSGSKLPQAVEKFLNAEKGT